MTDEFSKLVVEKSLEQEAAEKAYPDHHPDTALANYRAGRQVWDTNGDIW